jgi:hypothetical protein
MEREIREHYSYSRLSIGPPPRTLIRLRAATARQVVENENGEVRSQKFVASTEVGRSSLRACRFALCAKLFVSRGPVVKKLMVESTAPLATASPSFGGQAGL